MATLSAIYKISADITALQRGVEQGVNTLKRIDSQTSAMGQGFDRLKGVIAGTFTVTAVVAFTKELLSNADALEKLSDKTGLSLQALQRFQIVGDDAGNTIEQLTTAVSQMENRIASGDKSAVAALAQMGIKFEDFRKLNPEQQFYEISRAIQGIQDPAKQTQLAMDLFGRTGAEILPTLKKGFKDVRDAAVGMSDDTIHVLGSLNDALHASWREFKNFTAEGLVGAIRGMQSGWNPAVAEANKQTAAFHRELVALNQDFAKMTQNALQSGTPGFINPAGIAMPTPETYRALTEQIERAVRATKERKQAEDDLAKSLEKVVDVNRAIIAQQPLVFNSEPLEREQVALDGYLTRLERVRDIEREVANATGQFNVEQQAMIQQIASIGQMLEQEFVGPLEDGARKLGSLDESTAKLSRAFADLAQVSGRSFGGILRDIGQVIGGINLATTAIKNFREAGNDTAGTLTKISSSMTLIGLVVIAIHAAVGLFRDAEVQVNDLRDAFVRAHGGIATLREEAFRAGVPLTALFNARNIEEYNRAIDDLDRDLARLEQQDLRFLQDHQDELDRMQSNIDGIVQGFRAMGASVPESLRASILALSRMEGLTVAQRNALFNLTRDIRPDFESLAKTAEHYGITLGQLGPRFQQGHLEDQVKRLVDDWNALLLAGADFNGVLDGMTDEVQTIVSTALRVGLRIPESMRPMIQSLIDAGLLFDLTGQKLSSITQLEFEATPLNQALQDLTDSINDLILALSGVNSKIDRVNPPGEPPDIGATPPPGEIVAQPTGPGVVLPPELDLLPSRFHGGGDVVAEVAALRADMRSRDALLERTLMQAVQVAVARAA